jgi:hypothetical protein
MLRDIEVENLTTIVTDNEEAVEHAEPEGWDGEEVHRRNGFAMITKKGEPPFGSLWFSRCSFHPAGNCSLGNIKSQQETISSIRRKNSISRRNSPETARYAYPLSGSSP